LPLQKQPRADDVLRVRPSVRDGRDLRAVPLIERKDELKRFLRKDSFSLRFVDHLPTDSEKMLHYAVSTGMDGVVAKKAESIHRGGVSRQWLKSKTDSWHDGFQGCLNAACCSRSRAVPVRALAVADAAS
jgi:ATP-dependent DNA ligase